MKQKLYSDTTSFLLSSPNIETLLINAKNKYLKFVGLKNDEFLNSINLNMLPKRMRAQFLL